MSNVLLPKTQAASNLTLAHTLPRCLLEMNSSTTWLEGRWMSSAVKNLDSDPVWTSNITQPSHEKKMGVWIVCSHLPKHSMQYKNCTNSSIKHAPGVCSFGRVFMSNTVWHCWGLYNYHSYPQIFLCPRTHVLAASCCSPFRHVHRSHTQWDPLIRACSCSVIGHLPVAYHVCKSSYLVIIPMKRPLLPLWQIGTYQQTDLPPEHFSRAPNPAQEKKK